MRSRSTGRSGRWGGSLNPRALRVSAVISGVTSLGDVRQLGKLSSVTITYYLITVGIAVFIGLVMVNLIQPGVGISTEGLGSPDEVLNAV